MVRKALALLALTLLVASPVMAEVSMGPGGTVTKLIVDGESKVIGDVFAESDIVRLG